MARAGPVRDRGRDKSPGPRHLGLVTSHLRARNGKPLDSADWGGSGRGREAGVSAAVVS